MIPLKISLFELALKKFLAWVFNLFNSSTDEKFVNSLFSTASDLFKNFSQQFTPYQINTILEIIKQNLQHYALQPNVYGLLKSIVDKGI